MAFNEIVEGTRQQKAARSYILDSVDDLDNIPTDKTGPGSTAIIPSAGKIYFLTPDGAWTQFGGSE
ncbi:MAG: hypothetical protein IJF88_05810 [Oscillospiraceae bacterium]|nr:hypothetical protein [Oscillospiraceae bacterium]